jgi:hypothetical protein
MKSKCPDEIVRVTEVLKDSGIGHSLISGSE